MKNILIIGAGKSASSLINYILKSADKYDWQVTIADRDIRAVEKKLKGNPRGKAIQFNVKDKEDRKKLAEANELVISLLPAFLHDLVARTCLDLRTHLLTASYVSNHMAELSKEAERKGIIFMGEMGLDPGIDHMSAMKHLDRLRDEGNEILSFKSYTGGLVAPESDNNPWHYKFTWNPRNVILAGQGTAQYLWEGKLKYIPYNRLFNSADEVEILNHGTYEVYANRDSLLYREAYNLEDIPTIFRGTLRNVGFSESWDAFVDLGLTDDSYPILQSEHITYRDLILAFTAANCESNTVEGKVAETLGIDEDSEIIENMKWTGIFEDKKIGLSKASPAKILEHLLRKKWMLNEDDKDMVIMQHEFVYIKGDEKKKLRTSLCIKGENSEETAMSRLVGLPLGILAKRVMLGNIKSTYGVHIPVKKYVYEPVLDELESHGVKFDEELTTL